MSLGLWSVDGWPVQLLGRAVAVVSLVLRRAGGVDHPGGGASSSGQVVQVQAGRALAVCAHLRGAGACRGRLAVSLPLLLSSCPPGACWGIAGALVLGTGQVQAMPGLLSVKMHKLSPKKAAL